MTLRTRGRPSALAAYARVWGVHAAMQLHSQPFLFPGSATRWTMLLVLVVLILRPSPRAMAWALIGRNFARIVAMPFVWDSEYWLALTDASVLMSIWHASDDRALPHVGRWVRCQLALCYAAAAFFKLNTAFLQVKTSCAPIFGLSLLERVPTVAGCACI